MPGLSGVVFRAVSTTIGAGLILTGCGASPGRTFDIRASEAKQILTQTEVPYDGLGSSDLRSYVVEKSPTELEWKVTLDGAKYCSSPPC